jgi:hypothetical protein
MTKLAFLSLWLLVFTIPWQQAVVLAQFGTITRGVGVLVVAFTILSVVAVGRIRPPSLIQLLMTAFMAWAVITMAWTIDPVNSPNRAATYLQLLVMVWALWQLSPQPEQQRSLIRAFVLGTAVPGVEIMVTRLTGSLLDEGRYAAAGMNPNLRWLCPWPAIWRRRSGSGCCSGATRL